MTNRIFPLISVGLFLALHSSLLAQNQTSQDGTPVTKPENSLPHSHGKFFATLDDYLAHLKQLGASDLPFYEQQPDGRYRLMTGRGGNRVPPVYFTRDELAKKFGFSE